ncbi:hypothetical protein [Deinococcus sp.]|uniref:hypothetical protein n=1 Tax=Deinococcus sp. TaxID=47478 RepID=UPI003CC6C186
MQNLARVIAFLGLVVVIVAAVLLVGNIYRINVLYASSILRNDAVRNPVYSIIWSTGLALVGGFVAGLGVALMLRRDGPALRRPS